VVFTFGVYVAGMAAALLLGRLADAARGRIGLAVVLGGAVVVVGNDPNHSTGELAFVPVLFAIAWLAGFALRERAVQAEAAERRAAQAEREREESARRAVFEERVRIARELHDVVAHHVSMMGVQAGAARVVVDRDPARAKEALSAIELSSRQAVAELHRLLGFLRQAGDRDDLAPQPGLSQLPRLAASMGDSDLAVAGQRRGRGASAAADRRRVGVPDRAGGADEHAQALGRLARGRAPALLARRARGRGRRRRPSRRRRGGRPGWPGADRHARAGRPARRAAQRRAGRHGRVRRQGQAPHPGGAAVSIAVLLADDQSMVRAGFRMILESDPDVEVVGEAATGEQAVAATRRLQPDVVLMDIQMPGGDGLEATRRITGSPDAGSRVVILTTFERDEYVFEALQAGASGFLLKNAPPEQLVDAVRVVAPATRCWRRR
jgi:CheY-like chemotaxis protein